MEQVKLYKNNGGIAENECLRTLRITSHIKDPARRTLSVRAHRRGSSFEDPKSVPILRRGG